MSENAISSVKYINDEYKRFLKTTFHFADPKLQEQYEKHLYSTDVIVKGPYVTLNRPYAVGKTLKELQSEGLVHADLSKVAWPFGEKPLYTHQEKAIRTTKDNKPYLVTTGTGSGKTECFLLPILNHLAKTPRKGPGVRAILMYPMNALANDQLERLRRYLRTSGLKLSFALYTGDSEATANSLKEPPVEGMELIKRDDIRNNPPDIILTNYKQLEFLLIREADRHLFTPELKFLVLDEIHSYRGALATEIACLIRRLKAHSGVAEGDFYPIGTSATVSSDAGGNKALAEFASDLFSEKFDPADIISEEYKPVVSGGAKWEPAPAHITIDDVQNLKIEDDDSLRSFTEKLLGKKLTTGGNLVAAIQTELEGNLVFEFIESYFTKPHSVAQAAADIKSAVNSRKTMSESYLELEISGYLLVGSASRDPIASRIKPRLHVFSHGIYDVGLCMNPACKTLVTNGGSICPECASPVLPAAVCRTCGQHFAKGFEPRPGEAITADDTWKSGKGTVFLTDKLVAIDEDEEESTKLVDRNYCLTCRTLTADITCNACGQATVPYKVLHDGASKCPACASFYPKGDVITPLRSGLASSISVLMSLHLDHLTGADRKLLVFSDNRQDAAHQAGYTADRQRKFAIKHAIANVLKKDAGNYLALESLHFKVFEELKILGMVPSRPTRGQEENWKKTLQLEVALEFCSYSQRRIALENLGIVTVDYEFLADVEKNPAFLELCKTNKLTPDFAINLTRGILDLVRRKKAVDYDFFKEYLNTESNPWLELKEAPYELSIYDREKTAQAFAFKRETADLKSRINGIVQENDRGRAPAIHTLVKKVIPDRGDSEKFIRALFDLLKAEKIVVVAENFKLNPKMRVAGLELLQIAKDKILVKYSTTGFKCPACQTWKGFDTGDVCLNPQCPNGKPKKIDVDGENYYVRMYTVRPPQKMRVREHTAQIKAEDRAKIEKEFKEAFIDTLVCSPTLELGVDLGELITLIMRNAPPMPANYTQRAGRAGRRLKIPYVNTFCSANAHDRHCFEHPEWLITGAFKPPHVRLDNPKIVYRHINSFIFEALKNQFPALLGNLLDNKENPTTWDKAQIQPILDEIKARRVQLADQVMKLFKKDKALGKTVKYDRAEVERIIDDLPGAIETLLARWWGRVEQLIKDYNELSNIGADRYTKQKAFARQRAFWEITKDHDKAYTLNYFSQTGIMPAYQFPIDTAWLDSGVLDVPTLQRPAALGLFEFAPGNIVYANGRKLKSIRVLLSGPQGQGHVTLGASGRVRTYYFCEKCDYSTEQIVNDCPICGKPLANKTDVVFVESFEAEEADKINAYEEGRQREYFKKVVSMLDEQGQDSLFYKYSSTPVEFRHLTKFIVTNWGKKNRGDDSADKFDICQDCGRHRAPDCRDDNKKLEEWNLRHQKFCRGEVGTYILGHDFTSDALVISVPRNTAYPVTEGRPDAYMQTLSEALLVGAVDVLEVERGEIGAFVRDVGKKDEAQIVFYETIPGGAGYLEEMAKKLPEVARAATERLFGHKCGKACYLCLKHYGNQMHHAILDKDLIEDTLFEMSNDSVPSPITVKIGEGRKAIRSYIAERQREAIETRGLGQTGKGPQSPIEAKLLAALKRIAGLPEPVAQFEYKVKGRLVTIPDFAYLTEKIAIFCDGYQFHGNPQTLDLDAEKRNTMQADGWKVLTFWGKRINNDSDLCAQKVFEVWKRVSKTA